MSLKHDLLNHPFQRRKRYELHNVDALFRGFSDETLKLEHRSACDEGLSVATIITAVKLKNAIADSKGKEGDEVVLIAREKGNEIRPITLVIDGSKGKKKRADRLTKRVKEIAAEYAERHNTKVHYHEEV